MKLTRHIWLLLKQNKDCNLLWAELTFRDFFFFSSVVKCETWPHCGVPRSIVLYCTEVLLVGSSGSSGFSLRVPVFSPASHCYWDGRFCISHPDAPESTPQTFMPSRGDFFSFFMISQCPRPTRSNYHYLIIILQTGSQWHSITVISIH